MSKNEPEGERSLWAAFSRGGSDAAGEDGKASEWMDAGSYRVAGSTVIGRSAAGDGIVFNLGAPQARRISGGAIDFAGSHMLVSAEEATTGELATIRGGSANDLLLLRKAAGGPDVTLRHGAGIACGGDRVLGDNRGLWVVCIEPGIWSAEG